jgi:hypothetical protein
LESEVAIIKKELRVVNQSVNKTEMATKNLLDRILGLPVIEDETPATIRKNMYDKIIKLILRVAKDKGHIIISIPQLNTIIEDAFRLNYAVKDVQGSTLPSPVHQVQEQGHENHHLL